MDALELLVLIVIVITAIVGGFMIGLFAAVGGA